MLGSRVLLFGVATLLLPSLVIGQSPNVRRAKQGYSMKLQFDNRGVSGKYAYGLANPPVDSIGLEYPVGSRQEHLYGGGLWLGGKLDTSAIGQTGPQSKLVSTAFEGWGSGGNALTEFYPGSSLEDSIWRISGRSSPKPPNWDSYWGAALPYRPISDNDDYCQYTDTGLVPISNHVPLRLRVIQSSFVWNQIYADAIHLIQYKIINAGRKVIDSLHIAYFADSDVGPATVPSYFQRNYSAYDSTLRLAYTHNPIDLGATPFGVALLDASRPLDSLRITFEWYHGNQTPPNDVAKYDFISSGNIKPDEYPNLSDSRLLLSAGPFTLRPGTDPQPDTVLYTIAIVSGQNINAMRAGVLRARDIWFNGVLGVNPGGGSVAEGFRLYQNYPNPFNPSTNFTFSIVNRELTTLKVYDLLGREVATLVNEVKEPGTYEATWDASGMASGVYIYKLQAGDFVATRKLLLLK